MPFQAASYESYDMVWLMYETPQVRRLKCQISPDVPSPCALSPALSAVLRSIVDADVFVGAS